MEASLEGFDEDLTPGFPGGGEELDHEHIRIAVHDQAGQAVALRGHQPGGGIEAPGDPVLAPVNGELEAGTDAGGIKFVAWLGGEDAGPDFRGGMDGGTGDEGSISSHNIRLVEGAVPFHPGNGARHDPGMAPDNRDLAPRLEMKFQCHTWGELNHIAGGRSNGRSINFCLRRGKGMA